MTRMLVLLAAAVVTLGAAAPAEGQIYSWQDATGSLVLSDRPPADGAQTYSVARAASVRSTRPGPSDYSEDYDRLIQHYASAGGVRPDLVRAVIQVESGFNSRAVSPKGAMGLMQLMPATAAELGVGNPFDPNENIRGGVTYLRQLLAKFNNNEELALAAYNAGPEAVDRYGQRIPPYRETRDYVQKVKSRTSAAAPSAKRVLYKTIEIVDGREVVRLTDTKPASGPYEIIGVRR